MWAELRRSLLPLVLGFVLGGLYAGQKSSIQTLNRKQVAFAQAHNQWRGFVVSLSPESPDFWEQVQSEWERRQISQKFQALEAEVGR